MNLAATRIAVHSAVGVERARREARQQAERLGFGLEDVERIALATTELATNLVRYAYAGEIVVRVIAEESRREAVEIESCDGGPGIPDVERALCEGFSTGGGLGAGLPSVRRLMDDFDLNSGPNGTRVVVRKWRTTRP